jgi:hypothetical protein
VALTIIFGILLVVVPSKSEKANDWPAIMAIIVGIAVFGGLLLWLSYRLTRATPARAAELFTLLRLKPPPPKLYS